MTLCGSCIDIPKKIGQMTRYQTACRLCVSGIVIIAVVCEVVVVDKLFRGCDDMGPRLQCSFVFQKEWRQCQPDRLYVSVSTFSPSS